MKRLLTLGGLVVIATAVIGTAACGDDDSDGTAHNMPGMSSTGMMNASAPEGSIQVQLVNWAVKPARSSAKAGQITFFAVHAMDHQHGMAEGGEVHDLQVMRKKSDGTMELVGQVQGLKMGDAKALTLNLTAGDFELSCNVVEEIDGKAIGHYAKGMRAPFTVTS